MTPVATDIAGETDPAGAGACPDDELLLGYVEGQHAAATLARLDAHIERCGRCEDALRLFALVTGSPCARQRALPDVPARYRVLEALGQGGQATVWRAHDTRLGRDVALKLVHCPEPRHRQRLRTEARALAALDHPNVLEIFDVELSSNPGFLTMPVYRESLADDIRGGTSATTALEAMRQVARGLSAVHRAGLVHRDIKPANLLRDGAGTVVLGDFGIVSMSEAKTLSPPSDPEPSLDETLTTVCGTPAYMAPEVCRGQPHTPASDQYAFFVSLAQLITGSLPAWDRTWDGGPSVPTWLVRVVRRGLSRDPADRFPSLDAVRGALEGPRRWRAMAPWLALAVVPVAALAYAQTLEEPPAVAAPVGCSRPAPSPWSAAMTDAVTASGHPLAAQWSADLAAQVDAFTDGVSGASAQACRETRHEALLCLARLVERVDAMTSRLADGNVTAAGVDRLHQSMPELVSFEHCMRVDERVGASAVEASKDRTEAAAAVHGAYADGVLTSDPGAADRATARALAQGRLEDHPDLHAIALRRTASSRLRRGDVDLFAPNADLDAAVALAQAADAPAVAADIWAERANTAYAVHGDTDAALRDLEFADAALARAGSPAPGTMRVAFIRASALLARGDAASAQGHAEVAAAIAQDIGASAFRARALLVEGEAIAAQGRDGIAVMEQAADLMRDTHAVPGPNLDEALLKLTGAYLEAGQPRRAMSVVQPIVQRLGQTRPGSVPLAYALELLGSAALDDVPDSPTDPSVERLHATARDAFERALTIYTDLGSPVRQGVAESNLGRLALEQNAPVEAEAHYLRALKHLEQVYPANDPDLETLRDALAHARAAAAKAP